MAFISVDDELAKKSMTAVENKFITKYLPELEPSSIKVYLYSLYLYQNGQSAFTLSDLAKKLKMSEDETKNVFEYLEEFELVSITSLSPFEVKILDCENYFGTPKKLHPEKYEGLYEEIQSAISGRMVSQNEFRDYLILIEEYGIERNALLMIINYCVNLKDDKISAAYIKKVARNFEAEGVTTAAKVEEKLSSYTASTSALLKLFAACGIKHRPEVEDDKRYFSWRNLGFDDEAIIFTAKVFKVKSTERLDAVIAELYKNKLFDVKEIDDYRKNKNSLYETAYSVAKTLGVLMKDTDPTPYVENYIGVWRGYGFSNDGIKNIAAYCFLCGRNSFDAMNGFVKTLYDEGYVDDESVKELIERLSEDDVFLKKVLSECSLTRRIIKSDRQALAKWRGWEFSDDMILKAAFLSAGKYSPIAAMSSLLSYWKNNGVKTVEEVEAQPVKNQKTWQTAKAAQKQNDTDVYMRLYAKLTNEENDE